MNLLDQIQQTTSVFGQLWFLFIHGGWVILVVVILYMLFNLYLHEIRHQYIAQQEWVFLSIKIPKTNQLSTLAVEQIFTQMHGIAANSSFAEKYVEGREQLGYSLEMVSLGGKTSFIIRAPKKNRELVESAFYAQYPSAEIAEVEDYISNVHYDPEHSDLELWGAEFKLNEHYTLPIKTYKEFEHPTAEIKIVDPLRPLFESLNTIKPYEVYAIQILIAPVQDKEWKPKGEEKAQKLIEGKGEEHHSPFALVFELLGGVLSGLIALFSTGEEHAEGHGEEKKPERNFSMLSDVEKEKVNGVLRKVSKPGFQTKIRHLYLAPKDKFDNSKKALLVGAYRALGTANTNTFKADSQHTGTGYQYIVSESLEAPYIDRVVAARKKRIFKGFKERNFHIGLHGYILNVEELATIYHLPIIGEDAIMQSPVETVESKKSQPPANLPIGEY